ncbi:diguanylate cyclase, partial [Oceanospirillum sp. HFRX-1_2]
EYKWFFDRGMVFERDADGKALRVTGTHSDISDQKQTEAALQESQQQFELAMRGSNDGLWDWRISDNQVYFSPRWKSMLGYADDELDNSFQVWESLVHPDDMPLAKEEVARCVVGKKSSYEVEFRLRHRQGHWISVLSRAIVVKDEDGHVARLVGTHMDLTEIRAVQKQLEESRQQLKKMAFYDALTGLPNRRLLEDRMTELLGQSQKMGNVLAVAMMDLDGFKQVNDTLGHDVGDELLKAVSGRLTLCMRDSDMIARLGGDEFVLLFTELSQTEDVISGLERVITVIGKPYMIAGNECRVTASIGVAFYPEDAGTGDILLYYA